MNLAELLQQVAAGALTPEAAEAALRSGGAEDLGFARVDLDRLRRRGLAEVIYCPGKTPDQIARIAGALIRAGQDVLATRANAEQYEVVHRTCPEAVYHEASGIIAARVSPAPVAIGQVAVVCAGTSDIPVAEEAALTAAFLGARVERVFDVGVAGLHRLFPHLDLLRQSRAIVVVAGMEGALPSVVGGLIDRPLIAVPTSIGYGASFQGLTPLLAMLNSCAPGVTVVNIDNGFGAGVAAALINRIGEV